MGIQKNNFKKTANVSLEKRDQVLGLASFTKKLEKHFFASVSIYFSDNKLNKINVVLEMYLNFELSDVIRHYEAGTWGYHLSHNNAFLKFVTEFKEANNNNIEIDELSLHFENTSIIINKIYENSVAEQFDSILQKISENYKSFSQDESHIPYEIFIPVFEQENVENDLAQLYSPSHPDFSSEDYFKFWALYYDGESKAAIYDTRSSMTTSGRLYYLNEE